MVSIRQLSGPSEMGLVLPALLTLDQYYPNIGDWFERKVLSDSTGSSVAIGAFESDTLVGFVLGKRGDESKLRCVRVAESHQNSGLGLKLLERGMDLLECEQPLVTVSEELLGQYSRIFVNRYGYSLDQVVKGAYRRGKLEYVFNGAL
ncbi:hypothetical protein pEaSNUABM54_00196 [Erwinia phage pEa_SNUABM_54]|nr:hypothetical protein pEaSNUABM54_00196 [Erwinia phage pEa_SNUABM_54]